MDSFVYDESTLNRIKPEPINWQESKIFDAYQHHESGKTIRERSRQMSELLNFEQENLDRMAAIQQEQKEIESQLRYVEKQRRVIERTASGTPEQRIFEGSPEHIDAGESTASPSSSSQSARRHQRHVSWSDQLEETPSSVKQQEQTMPSRKQKKRSHSSVPQQIPSSQSSQAQEASFRPPTQKREYTDSFKKFDDFLKKMAEKEAQKEAQLLVEEVRSDDSWSVGKAHELSGSMGSEETGEDGQGYLSLYGPIEDLEVLYGVEPYSPLEEID